MQSSILLRIAGWSLGATSLLNLIQDAGLVSIVEKLALWLRAYNDFVVVIGGYLFGWMSFAYMDISPHELHIIVLTSVFASAAGRTTFAAFSDEPLFERVGLTLAIPSAILGAVVLTALVFPLGTGYILSSVLLAHFIFISTVPEDANDLKILATARAMRQELVGVIGFFLVVLAINYGVIKST